MACSTSSRLRMKAASSTATHADVKPRSESAVLGRESTREPFENLMPSNELE